MKSTYLFFFWLSFLFIACQETPEFPDPKFDSTDTRVYEVRRDTADFVNLECFMDVPNGIDRIEILEGRSYEVLDVLEEYKGEKELDFNYQVDISDIVRDSSLAFIVKVYDLKYRTYNKAFMVRVKKFSVPEIILEGGETISTDVDAFSIRATLTTGMIPIRQVRLTVDGEKQELPVVEEDMTEYVLNYRIPLRRQKEYSVQILLEDVDGRRTTKVVKIFKVREMEKPVKILCGGRLPYEVLLEYDEQNRISLIDILEHYKFQIMYDQIKEKEVIRSISQSGYGLENPDYINYVFNYDTTGMLQNVTESWGAAVTYHVGQCLYDKEKLNGFVAGAVVVTQVAYEDITGIGEIMSEVWGTAFAATLERDRLRATDFQTMRIPTYLKQLPYSLFVPFKVGILFQDVFLSPYVYLKMVKYLDASVVVNNFSYKTDEKGRLSSLTRTSTSTGSDGRAIMYYYQFVYKDTVLPEN
ncbi:MULTISPECIES: hypothetical protein [Butyricimonas]|uniref:hypothetical protein n=1 Tax=Butyricimonas TaxID=574697 RepID=UPI001D089C90|nr:MULTISPECIES: hypothetical protein [Butyricimonas]MCB6973912.1 hypothetical protein [Butyricimonas synergistica]MCG4520745.1 hypothetical protein [Butyricimonas sp. DFI.6.44]